MAPFPWLVFERTKIINKFSRFFVILLSKTPTGGGRKNYLRNFLYVSSKSRSRVQWCIAERIFEIYPDKRRFSWLVYEETFENGRKSSPNSPTGSEEHFITTKKGGTPMVKTLTTKTKGGYHYARFYGGAEGTAHLVPLDLG
jgi:hypothetical protein